MFAFFAKMCTKIKNGGRFFFFIWAENWRLHFVGGFFCTSEGKNKTVKSTSREGGRSMLLQEKRTIRFAHDHILS